jgi:hypothetical protein
LNDWGHLFLGLIAAAAVAQCVFVVIAALAVRKTSRDVASLHERFDREIKPGIDDLRAGAANFRAVSQSARDSAIKIEGLLATGIDSAQTAIDAARDTLVRPLRGLQDVSAFLAGVGRGISALSRDAAGEAAPSASSPTSAGPSAADSRLGGPSGVEARRRSSLQRAKRAEESGEEHLFIG